MENDSIAKTEHIDKELAADILKDLGTLDDLQRMADSMPGGFMVYTADDSEQFIMVNRRLLEILECNTEDQFMELTGGCFKGMVYQDDLSQVEHQITTLLDEEDNRDQYDYVQYRSETRSGKLRYIEDFGRLIHGSSGDFYAVFVVDIHEKFRNTNVDYLTGLLSMKGFQELADDFLKDSDHRNMKNLVFLWFDIRNFKSYNDEYGHGRGDEFLRDVGAHIKSVFPDYLTSRFHEDHFVVLTVDTRLQDRLMAVQDYVTKAGKKVKLSVSVGVYKDSDTKTPAAVCCDRAQMACNLTREDYTSWCRFYDPSLEHEVAVQRHVVFTLDEAIEKKFIKVYYQPVVDTRTGLITEAEALARWIEPTYGFLSPAEFIPVLEQHHLIYKLDTFIMKQVCEDYCQLRKQNKTFPVSINLSRLDFESCDIFEVVDEIRTEYKIPQRDIHIEITESALNDTDTVLRDGIDQFQNAGYQVWMDDFGAGYSSLNTLKDFHFDVMKIDMKFLQNLDDPDRSKATQAILAAVISMAKQLGIRTLAEGIETRDQYDFLKRLGCEMLQGFMFSKPVPLDQFMKLPGVSSGLSRNQST